MTEKSPPDIDSILRAMADFYGAPVVDCPLPRCRRARRCAAQMKATAPLCTLPLCVDTLIEVNSTVLSMLNGTYRATPATDPATRDIETVAIKIAKMRVARGEAEGHAFRAFLRRYRTPMISPAELAAFRAEVAAEHAATQKLIKSWKD
ncbi:hypothetical protein [Rhizobium sp. L1K21]|uniref:hypothetical protein n=1 Tax=Rhizobium sp. L1K21 TaxID=2954933 RepID=UPI0020936BB4|nr:hypothetical protein [Rhizobium sp. L1K21]MCO6186257.1 hypothetical protein [Rhizobium sp. L1K21]